MTETELALMSLTNEELDDAARFLAIMRERWRESRETANATGRDELAEIGFHGTEGPLHAILAADLAIVREQAIRGGAEPWYAGMELVGHPAAARLRYYQERTKLNPDQGVKPRLTAAGVLERVCPTCGEAKPLTVAFWAWEMTTLAAICRVCSGVSTAVWELPA